MGSMRVQVRSSMNAGFAFRAGRSAGLGLAAFGASMPAHAELYSRAPSAAVSSAHAVSGPKIEGQPKSWLEKVYVRAGVGYTEFGRFKKNEESSYLKKAPNAALLYTAGIGYKFTDSIRADLNFYYGQLKYRASLHDDNAATHDLRDLKQSIKAMGVMWNTYYDFRFNETFMPYLTVGAGIGRNDGSDLVNDSEAIPIRWKSKAKTSFVWNGGAGINVVLSKRSAIDLGYRYLDLGKIAVGNSKKFKGGMTQSIKGHQGLVAFIYHF